jgi:hypothetical protein
MNKRALKMACIIRWINANKGPTKAQLVIIKPKCLNVDKATTFFKSFSKSAIKPAKIIVIIPLINSIIKAEELFIKKLENRTTKNTPAVTRVDEWTKEEIGVGAAIAAGNQFLKGNCALLVKLPKISNRTKVSGTKNIFSMKTLFLNIKLEKTIIRNPSPKRLVRAVFILALQEEEFWKNNTRKKEVTPNPSHPIKRAKILLPKIKNTIDETNLIVKNRKRKISTSPFMYSLEKNRTDVTIIIKVLKKIIDMKSTTNLISKNLRKKNT